MAVGLYTPCKNCNNSIILDAGRRYRYKKGQKNFFCNWSCRTKYYNMIKNPMNKQSTRDKLSQTCLRQQKWSGKYNPNYGGENIRQLWQDGRYDKRDFSGENNPAWIDGSSLEKYGRGPDWNIQRLCVLKRDNYTCQVCESTKDIVVHHITPYKVSQNNSLINLLTVCRSCHGYIHTKIGWKNFKENN